MAPSFKCCWTLTYEMIDDSAASEQLNRLSRREKMRIQEKISNRGLHNRFRRQVTSVFGKAECSCRIKEHKLREAAAIVKSALFISARNKPSIVLGDFT